MLNITARREKQRAYDALRRARDPEKLRARERISSAKWRRSHPDRAYVAGKKWRLANPEKHSARCAKWSRLHPEHNRRKSAEQRAKNPLKTRALVARWKLRNMGKVYGYSAKRRATKKGSAVILSAEEKQQIAELYRKCKEITDATGRVHHVDHIVPLSRGGKHHPNNLQILEAIENLKKGTKVPVEVLRNHGVAFVARCIEDAEKALAAS